MFPTPTPIAKKPAKVSMWKFYFHSLVFGLIVYGFAYAYTSFNKTPGVLNKSAADASTILIGLSMLLTSLCYFFNFMDSKIIYRKYLGLIGFAFGVVHIGLSFSTLTSLFNVEVWQKGAMWPALTGLLATIIFTIMTLISNKLSMTVLGTKLWRNILRTGYLAMIFVWLHVVLLKSARWVTWYNGGMKTLPSMSLMVTVFITIVILMRVLMWAKIRLTKKK